MSGESQITRSAQQLIGTLKRATVGPATERILARIEALAGVTGLVMRVDVERALKDEAMGIVCSVCGGVMVRKQYYEYRDDGLWRVQYLCCVDCGHIVTAGREKV